MRGLTLSVLFLHVPLHTARVGERVTTVAAANALLHVRYLVFCQAAPLSEGPPTLCTLERFLPCVGPHVHPE